ncbi:MAG: arginine deiminase [Candidatus Cloacimonadota bacterium]|nr:MAG: arginine deiminase [Candidatus Cloacimonadota bacterium]PIE78467.1 MAG: arginine deiminase [Candidatus Delongbacteria bacterium]
MKQKKIHTEVTSEIGDLEAVIVHTPGREVENMTPTNAEKALYSDILNLDIAKHEHSQLKGVLGKTAKVFEIKELLEDILSNKKVKKDLINKICHNENKVRVMDYMMDLDSERLAKELLEGVPLLKNSLTRFISDEKYALRPLPNFFFTRDSASCVNNSVIINKMANQVRERESIIMESIFENSSYLKSETINPAKGFDKNENLEEVLTEGGDILVAREDILLVGCGSRTSTQGIDYLIEDLKRKKVKKHVIVQQLPHQPESFIHLDMVFTLLDRDRCMVYQPLILQDNRYRTIHIKVDNGKVKAINYVQSIISILKDLGMDLKPLYCGGRNDSWTMEREQWHSGANFFAMGPGKVIGYARNNATIEELNKDGFEVIKAFDVINNKVDLSNFNKFVVTLEGSELPRGGGGGRCMTMPIKRKNIVW